MFLQRTCPQKRDIFGRKLEQVLTRNKAGMKSLKWLRTGVESSLATRKATMARTASLRTWQWEIINKYRLIIVSGNIIH